MGISKEYQEVLGLLVELKDKINAGRIRFADLGADLIEELVNAGFEMNHSQEEELAFAELVRAYVNEYRRIVPIASRELETAYLETLTCVMKSWALLLHRQEESLMKQMQHMQKGVLPIQLSGVKEENVRHIHMDVRELFLQQNASVTEWDYQRLDVIVKYLAIENYFQKNDYGFALHQKLQALRARQSENMIDGYEKLSSEVFKDLIRSVEAEGFWKESEIICDKRLFLADGAHRLAICLYFKIPEVKVKVVDKEINVLPFTLDYLRQGGFTEKEILIIKNKAEELLDANKVNISCILWPPAAQYFDKITREIGNACRITEYHDYLYSEETFARLVKGVYHIDDIADWKVDKKLEAMKMCPVKKVRVMQLEILYPYFRLKDLNNNTISVIGERLKGIIRNEYKNLIDNYIYDIIIHTGDNFRQSEYMEKVFRPVISLEDYFAEIQEFSYFLVKHETPYLPIDFPKTYAFSKDIDIICEEEEYERLLSRTIMFIKESVTDYDVRILEQEGNTLIRIELNGYLMLQLDIGKKIDGIKDVFWQKALEEREEKDGYYLPSLRDELCIRANEYIKNRKKIHHLDFLKMHKEEIDLGLLEKYLVCDNAYIKEIEALI